LLLFMIPSRSERNKLAQHNRLQSSEKEAIYYLFWWDELPDKNHMSIKPVDMPLTWLLKA